MRLMCFLFVYTLLGSCQSNQRAPVSMDGYSVTNHNDISVAEKLADTGEMAERGYLSAGVKNGPWINYHSGKHRNRIKSITNYVNGNLNGLHLEFSNRGQIEQKINYVNNIYHGMFATYKNGRVEKEIIYDMGKLNGPYREYDKRGNLQKQSDYVNDKLHGKISYYDEGILIMEYLYENGEKVSGGIVEQKEGSEEESPVEAVK